MQTPSLLMRAKDRQPGFKKPDLSSFVPQEARDAVDRVVAAGMKIMYSPAMRDELAQEVGRDVPPDQKLADGVTGLMLTLDQKSRGGIPIPAVLPSLLMLLGEASNVLAATGQKVTQDDYNTAAMRVLSELGARMGAKPQQIMDRVSRGMRGGGQEPQDSGQMPGDEEEMA